MKVSLKAFLFSLLSPFHSKVKYLAHSYQFYDRGALGDAVEAWASNRAQALADYGEIGTWDVSEVTDMNYLFYYKWDFNDDISGWNTSKVTDMSGMFCSTYFNGDLSAWDTSNVADMRHMFDNARSFNGDLSNWKTSKVTTMTYMFFNTEAFNQGLSSWDTSSVTDMSAMFYSAIAFNGDLSSWDTSNVTDMGYMFYVAKAFNGDLSTWDTPNVKSMYSMFAATEAFNSDLSAWDISNVISMEVMFYFAVAFNQTLCWDISQVQYTNFMFYGSNGRVSDCARPTLKPTSAPTRKKCMENKEAKFLKAVEMNNYNFVPLMRSCEWLQKQKRAIRAGICNRDSFYDAPTAKETCPITCQTCVPF